MEIKSLGELGFVKFNFWKNSPLVGMVISPQLNFRPEKN